MQMAIDTGGTFTDCVYLEATGVKIRKVFSTPDDPAGAVLDAVHAVAGTNPGLVRHGTTVGTNALLERKGARVAFVTTAGFEDTIAIGRQARANLYDWFSTPLACIVPPELRFGIAERTRPDGSISCKPAEGDLLELADKIRASRAESIAVSLLFSFANPENELVVSHALRSLGLPISLSHVVLREFREYERASTVTVNAYLRPKSGGYLNRLEGKLGEDSTSSFEVMQSSGGIIPAGFAAEQPVRTILSGPAGGVIGACRVALQSGFSKIITFDMGGTSTDVCLIDQSDGGPRIASESSISGMPIAVPMLDIHTIGAGGGSLARFDAAGILHVGPESAGANPGPICYGRGTQPTVSDANLMLGRLHARHFLDGGLELDCERTRQEMKRSRGPLATVEDFAAGVVLLAEAAMERAIRLISVERGHDPREFTLVAFGGAGPLHACALATSLHMSRVLVPICPGALSALGILLADSVRDYSKTVMVGVDADLESHFQDLEQQAAEACHAAEAAASVHRSLDVRYCGQGYELNVPAGPEFLQSFHRAHKKRYGYCDERKNVEIVNLRVRRVVSGAPVPLPEFQSGDGKAERALLESRPMIFSETTHHGNVYRRELLRTADRIEGPALLVEYSATSVVPPGWSVVVDAYRNLVLEVIQ